MKKWLTGLVVIIVILLGSIYIYIPSTLRISDASYIHSSLNGVNRYLLDENKWIRWWPTHDSINNQLNAREGQFTYNGYRYKVSKYLYNSLELDIIQDNVKINSVIHVMHQSRDSIAVYWNAAFTSSLNPVKRVRQYNQAKKIKDNMEDLLISLKLFSEKTVNIYGFDIRQIMSKDSTLITTRFTSGDYPTTSDIYRLVNNLKTYAVSQGAKENNYPMLSVRKDTGNHFQTMVAIPLNKKLDGNGTIFPQRFVPWKTLTAEVRGGPYSISKAYEEMKIYTEDYQRESMAIPFESMITDRSIETDTTKWITLICQPVS